MMDRTSLTHVLRLGQRGYVKGKIISSRSNKPLCHYYGGVRYALSPTSDRRWKRPQPLPDDFSYGSEKEPGYSEGAGVCPQPEVEYEPSEWNEDCLQCNVWVPLGEVPGDGWPVFFFIHGGYLQYGSAGDRHPAALLEDTECKCIVVLPSYRLNIFGFLASEELLNEDGGRGAGNYGFWDQRAALEWVVENISYFGGNTAQITLGGLSAGAYSAFYQLGYDLLMSPSSPVIRHCFAQSNGPGIQPRPISSAQEQFDDVLRLLDIPETLTPADKLLRLRAASAADLIAATEKLRLHEFRAVNDGAFVSRALFNSFDDGTFAALIRRHGIRLLLSEVRDEHTSYATWRPPKTQSLAAVRARLAADYYPDEAVEALIRHFCPGAKLPEDCADWTEAFGRMYAAVQVRIQRGFADAMVRGGAGDLVRRVRTEWLTTAMREYLPPEMGVTHATDSTIWFWGDGTQLAQGEPEVITTFVGEVFWKFVMGRDEVESVSWWKELKGKPEHMRRLKPDGQVDIWLDEYWEDGTQLWKSLRAASRGNN